MIVTLTVATDGLRFRMHRGLKPAVQRAQRTGVYRRLGGRLSRPRVTSASARDLWLVRTLGVQPDPVSPGQTHRFVAKYRGLPVGYVALTVNPTLQENAEGENSLYLTRLRVHPLLRRLGIGRTLMNHAISSARESGYPEVLAEVLHGDAYLHQVYDHLDFVRIGDYAPTEEYPVSWSLWRRELR